MYFICRYLHRCFGLGAAVFLFISGLTGAIISWDRELDKIINPNMHKVAWAGSTQNPLDLARAWETNNPQHYISYLPLLIKEEQTFTVFVASNAEENETPLAYNQIALHPQTAEVLAYRKWGGGTFSRENFLPFLYRLHSTLHLPNIAGFELGRWLMGLIAVGWALDCLVALIISFPSQRHWYRSFLFRKRRGNFKANYDLHRSSALWLWPVLLTLAISSISMNLNFQIMRPLINRISTLSPSPFATQTLSTYSIARISREDILQKALRLAPQYNIEAPAGAMLYAAHFNMYGVGFFKTENDAGLGKPWLYFDASSGEFINATIPGTGSAGDIFLQAQFPLHSGRIAGLPGRLFISFIGLMVAVLSVSGVMIFLRREFLRKKSTYKK